MNIYKKKYECLRADFYNEEHYDEIIKESCMGYKENGEVLFVFIKNAIKKENRETYINAIKTNAKSKTKNRGTAAGVAVVERFPSDAVSLCKEDGSDTTNKRLVSVRYKRADGSVCGRCQSNRVRSGCAGYFDAVAGLPCRKVGWSTKNPERHNHLEKLCEEIAEVHKENEPLSYEYQLSKSHSDYLMGNSPYSTLTLNYDFRTACHIDRGDLINSLSTLTILEEIEENYSGCYLGLPEYKIAIDVKGGDTLIFDAHEYHANTEMKVLSDKLPIDDLTGKPFGGRISIVAYLRNRISECDNQPPNENEDY